MYGYLTPLHGGDAISLESSALTLGRAPACDVVIRHKSVSGRHCRMKIRKREGRVKDLGSRNGTCIDGEKVETGRIQSGQVLRLGSVRFEVTLGPASAEASEPVTPGAATSSTAGRSRSGSGGAAEAAGLRGGTAARDGRDSPRTQPAQQSSRQPEGARTSAASSAASSAGRSAERKPQAAITRSQQPDASPKRPMKRFRGKLTPAAGGDPIALLDEKIVVGRDRDSGIRLKNSVVSKHHCELEFQDGYWCVRDLGSRNGIRIDGEKTMEGWLMPGATLSVGKLRFDIDYQPQSDEPPPPLDPIGGRSLLEKAGLSRELESDKEPDWLASDQDPEPSKRVDLESL